ncbi:MAG: GNAT family N-acetyltransferase [Rhodospirillales bacterium]|nr:GNAT family N-acetyltransferase [Rhodospirillales bacterium]
MTEPLSPVERLDASHDVAAFDCGVEALNVWLKRYALQNQSAGASRTYVARRGAVVVGYYALAAGDVEHQDAPNRVARGLPRHPVPLVVLARLAVDRAERGSGLGRALLKDALVRITDAADIIGVRAVVVHAKDEVARAFYERFDFEPSPVDPLTMFLLMKDLKRTMGSK